MKKTITIRGARQHNLQNVDVEVPINKLTVVTGVSGSGKSSLAFDTLYAEGQRRYVESFSAYARQFLERMDRPELDDIDGILPAVAIEHRNHIRSSRSTVGTVTEIADYLKVLFARGASLHCNQCGETVGCDTPEKAAQTLVADNRTEPILVTFPFDVQRTGGQELAEAYLRSRGYLRVLDASTGTAVRLDDHPDTLNTSETVLVIQDRIQPSNANKSRLVEALEQAFREGQGHAVIRTADETLPLSNRLHCAPCDKTFNQPVPALFGFNTPFGACPTCNGFGRVIGLDLGLCVPNDRLSIAKGTIRPWTTPRGRRERYKLHTYCRTAEIPMETPWRELSDDDKSRVIDGDPTHRWRGLKGWFKRLERKAYKMHVRVFLSRYRAYLPCEQCHGQRFRKETLCWRLGGKTISQFNALSVGEAHQHVETLDLPNSADRALRTVIKEIADRLQCMVDLGLDYLTLSRASRTLSGGEIQRVNLTSALGSELVGTLYVLDEPSVGLHSRDNERLLSILRRIRDLGNTVVVIEHDEAIIRGADRVIDMGPGPGSAGGTVVFQGTPAAMLQSKKSITGQCLRQGTAKARPSTKLPADTSWCTVRNAREHNLKNIDFSFPVGRMTCVSGVSGSGKSTLVVETLHKGLLRARGEPTTQPATHDEIEGSDQFGDIILINAAPIATSARSNAATYLKAWDGVRKAFAAEPEAQRRGFDASSFSFNVRGGRCDVCDGVGYERVEMQFLSDVFLLCEACAGARFQADVLDVRHHGLSIHDVLNLTATDAIAKLGHIPAVARALQPLIQVGLGYVRLGQPLNTLSVGEAQRLKLAAGFQKKSGRKKASGKPSLFILDEPTSGLHLRDVEILLSNLRALSEKGHTVVVVEHHLDVLRAADYVVDLGPCGGHQGGQIVVQGSPKSVAACPKSHTGRWMKRETPPKSKKSRPIQRPDHISVRGARVHNLKEVSVEIEHGKRTVITGPSGSGKSSLAFDVLFAEGQRRFLDCLSPYARQYLPQASRPDIDELIGIPPTVAIEQRTTRWGKKTTVATVTEVYQFLRLLYARIGVQHCHCCGHAAQGLDSTEVEAQIRSRHAKGSISLLAPVIRRRKGWHKEIIARAIRLGHSHIRIDGKIIDASPSIKLTRFQEHDVEYVLWNDAPIPTGKKAPLFVEALAQALNEGRGTCYVRSNSKSSETFRYSTNMYCASCQIGFDCPEPRTFSFHGTRSGACQRCDGAGVLEADGDRPDRNCPDCEGTRLGPISRAVLVDGTPIQDVAARTAPQLLQWLDGLSLSPRDSAVASPIVTEIRERCEFLCRVGLDYLALGRSGHTLSGGEAQRVRLAAQLSAKLSGVLYVLDEPTIGLHPKDNDRLLDALDELQSRGNSIVIVEHDKSTIESADKIVDMGPGGGTRGGHAVAIGSPKEIQSNPQSITGTWLQGAASLPIKPRSITTECVQLQNVKRHNLNGLNVGFPVRRFTVVTGVSGSGKSTLVRQVLLPLAKGDSPVNVDTSFRGHEAVQRVVQVDQSPIGRTPRSTPATYIGIMDRIRKLFANLPEAKIRGFSPGRFSFNAKVGQCPACKGQGAINVEMAFLPNTFVPCDVCAGRRYNAETLLVTYRGQTIADVLESTVSEAIDLFAAHPRIQRPLTLMADLGLDYLTLGQASNTLSGGEAQRIKLVTELHKRHGGNTLYVLDEPSTGLHMSDLSRLLDVIHRLVEAGNTMVVIEHNLDVIAAADWVIDLGPGGGDAGGNIVFEGTPKRMGKAKGSHTAVYLQAHINGGLPK